MYESEQERELAAWEARLSAFRPGPSRLDRDRVMYLAGRASVEKERAGAAGPCPRWFWPAALAGMTAVAGCLAAALIVRQPGDGPSTVPGGPGSVAQEPPRAPRQDRDRMPGDRDDRELPVAERQRVFWPRAEQPETLPVRPPRSDDADRTYAQLAEGRVFEAGERRCPPGSFGPPVGPDSPPQPRSYVERRRMLLEELECFGETSSQAPFRRQPTGV